MEQNFKTMKKLKISQRAQDIFWATMCGITAIAFVWTISLFY